MVREIFVVARNRPDLYRYLSQTFADAENVQVIWDRRGGDGRPADRRQAPDRNEPRDGGRSPERRRGERRTRATVDHELRTVGYVFISI